MKIQVVLEYDPETKHWTGTVPSYPGIVVDAKSRATAIRLAKEAVGFAREEDGSPRRIRATVVEVDVPA